MGTITAREVLTLALAVVAFVLLALNEEKSVPLVVDLELLGKPFDENVVNNWTKQVTADWEVWAILALQILVNLVLFALFMLAASWFLIRRLKYYRGPLCLNLEELSMSLPDGHLHSQWRDLYSVTEGKKRLPRIILQRRRPWCIFQRVFVRVELNDGLVARLYVPKDDCQPLADLMRTLIRCHRQTDAASTKPSSPVPGCFKHFA